MDWTELFDDDEVDGIRRRVVEIWARARVSSDEIGNRLGIDSDEVIEIFACEIVRGQSWSADAIMRLYRQARGGDADAATTIVFASCFEQPNIAELLHIKTFVN